MAHNDESFEAKGHSDAEFAVHLRQDRRQPSSLSGVEEQKDDVVVSDKVLKLLSVAEKLFVLFLGNGVSGHWDTHDDTLSLHFRINFGDSLGGNRGLEVVICPTVFEGEEALADRIAVADPSIVHKCKLCVPPTEEVASDLTPERARTEEQAPCILQNFQVQIRCLSPLHQLKVKADGLLSQIRWIHLAAQLDDLGSDLGRIN